jgi:ATP-dependent RNA helicase RhlB
LKFSELDLHPLINAGIQRLNFADATPIQEATIPHVLEGRDVAGLAQTGTGKTAAFLLPLMERIVEARLNPEQLTEEEKARREKRMFTEFKPHQFILVLVPTRELAEQVWENAERLKGDSGIRTVSIYGGVSYDKQKQALREGVEIVVATPGRLIDLYKENLVDLKQVRAIVFDEADRMFDMGFKDDMKYILQRVPKDRQFLVFSATLNLDVMSTAYQFGANPVEVNVSRDQATAENVDHKIFHVGQDEKGQHLLSLLKKHNPRQTIVFSNFKMNVPRITQFLNDNGVPTVGISSLLTQSQRNRVMEQFKGESEHNILVATDVAARGLDIKGVDMVVNFELPDDPENYVHRIGRTGRAGAKGLAFSLVSDRDVDALARVEQYLRHKVDVDFMEETELVKDYKDMTSDRGYRGEGRAEGGRGGPRGEGRGGRGEGRRGEGRGEARGGRDGGRRGESRGRRSEGRGEGRPERQPGAEQAVAAGANGAQAGDSRPSRPGARPQPQAQGAQQGQGRGRRDGRRDQRAEGRGDQRGGRDQQQRNGQGPRRHEGGPQRRHEGPQQAGRRNEGPRKDGHKQGPTPAPRSLGKKVTGFFKRLFGG